MSNGRGSEEERLERSSQELDNLEEIKKNIRNINEVIKRILDLLKQPGATLIRLEVCPLMEETLKFWYSKLAKERIELKSSLEENLYEVLRDPIEIQQVLNNLVQNAIESRKDGGALSITFDNGLFSFDKRRQAVVVKVQDSGAGIPLDQQKSIFNPFFMTKSKGTGLGLAISHWIISRHEGIISFESVPSVGTTFGIELPAAPRG